MVEIEDREKQLREIDVHKTLNHKYVVRLIDYDILEDRIVMLIEYAKYGDLFGFLRRAKNLDHRKIVKFFYKIIQSVMYLHNKKMVHRDIKPENILITSNFRPKLADFGTSAKSKEIKNTFCGTYEYMAPEIYMRLKQTEKVDIWSLGILIYEMTHLRTPFKEHNLTHIKSKILNKKINFKESLNPLVKDFFYKVCQINP